MAYWRELRASDKEALKLALDAADKAVNKAEQANVKSFEAANEVKATFGADLTRKLDRTEYDAAHHSLQKQVENLSKIVFIGVGISIGLQFLIPFLLGK